MERVAPVPIVALDFASLDEALRLVERLGHACDFYKVGSALFTVAGPPAVKALRDRGKRVFLDLKYHDIPQTVSFAAAAAARSGASLLTVHASGGEAMLRAAVDGAGPDCGVLAVSLLTSLAANDVSLAWGREVSDLETEVVRLAGLAAACGVHGIVCGGDELPAVRSRLAPELATLVPGIRFADGTRNDQRRVVTPAEAAARGATYIVAGRAVTGAPDAAAAMKRLCDEMRSTDPV